MVGKSGEKEKKIPEVIAQTNTTSVPDVSKFKFTKNLNFYLFFSMSRTKKLHFSILLCVLFYLFREICGWVDALESAKTVGQEKKYNIIKFVLNNNGGKRIQCCAWQNEVQRVQSVVSPNKVNILITCR